MGKKDEKVELIPYRLYEDTGQLQFILRRGDQVGHVSWCNCPKSIKHLEDGPLSEKVIEDLSSFSILLDDFQVVTEFFNHIYASKKAVNELKAGIARMDKESQHHTNLDRSEDGGYLFIDSAEIVETIHNICDESKSIEELPNVIDENTETLHHRRKF